MLINYTIGDFETTSKSEAEKKAKALDENAEKWESEDGKEWTRTGTFNPSLFGGKGMWFDD